MNLKFLLLLSILSVLLISCSGKYTIKTYPPQAKVYVRNIQSKNKVLVGTSPVKIKEESELGDVFFLVFEKDNYKDKEVMVRVNEGESLTLTTKLDPLTDLDRQNIADGKSGNNDDENQKGQTSPQGEENKDKMKKQLEDVKLRVALLENTVSFYKDAMFSARFKGGMAEYDRDRSDKTVQRMFNAQKLISLKRYREAIRSINSVIKNDEYNANAWLLKGSTYYLMGSYSMAKQSWERCLQINPHDKVAYRYLNKVYAKMGIKSLPGKPAALRYPASQVEIEKRNR